MKTSSILSPATSDSNLTSSGSFGRARMELGHPARSISMTAGVLGVGVALQQHAIGDPVFHGLDAALRVRGSW